ncbi:arginine--tRNA ligase [Oscillibacter sp.]|uniref:arginine--tRNA ligase n=1 Tax=Oscillibacter sp. TaxID=1945593 RepID=UPI002D7F5E0A|nr:arginine--tRNA ligase [Oscillibacter sp.]
MTNMMQNAKDQAAALAMAAYRAAAGDGSLPQAEVPAAPVEVPRDAANGDFTTTFALAASKSLRRPPRAIAQALLDHMDLEGSYFASAEIAGPGFLNFRLGGQWYEEVCAAVEREGADYGRSDSLKGQKIMVEFVSANPTGPMHMGNARGGVLGDTLASVLSACGAEVSREFYVNDAGHQIDKFARSIYARCMQLTYGEDSYAFPEDGYQGDDIRELARGFLAKTEDFPGTTREEFWMADMAEYGLSVNLPKMKEDLRRYKIEYDTWFYESNLHNSGAVAETAELLTKAGWTYEKDGALWLKTAQIMRENLLKAGKKETDIEKLELKDDVLRRANGFYTYFAADIAYHRNKFETRGFDRVINIWGADHHGHVARLKGALDVLGLDGSGKLDIVLMQLVKLLRDGELVKMSKRTGKAISLSDLLDEVPVDAARWFFNAKPDTQMDFDLGLAVREDSENPIYYVEYAHARICSLVEKLAGEGLTVPAPGEADLSLLTAEAEAVLIKQLAAWPDAIRAAAKNYDPSHVNRYLMELAGCFHRFYTACHIREESPALAAARLRLADDARIVLKNGLALIGVDAPEHM